MTQIVIKTQKKDAWFKKIKLNNDESRIIQAVY